MAPSIELRDRNSLPESLVTTFTDDALRFIEFMTQESAGKSVIDLATIGVANKRLKQKIEKILAGKISKPPTKFAPLSSEEAAPHISQHSVLLAGIGISVNLCLPIWQQACKEADFPLSVLQITRSLTNKKDSVAWHLSGRTDDGSQATSGKLASSDLWIQEQDQYRSLSTEELSLEIIYSLLREMEQQDFVVVALIDSSNLETKTFALFDEFDFDQLKQVPRLILYDPLKNVFLRVS